jgi:hypothetical protein
MLCIMFGFPVHTLHLDLRQLTEIDGDGKLSALSYILCLPGIHFRDASCQLIFDIDRDSEVSWLRRNASGLVQHPLC